MLNDAASSTPVSVAPEYRNSSTESAVVTCSSGRPFTLVTDENGIVTAQPAAPTAGISPAAKPRCVHDPIVYSCSPSLLYPPLSATLIAICASAGAATGVGCSSTP